MTKILFPPEKELFYSRKDPNDIRLGDIVRYKERDYSDCKVVLVGCPQDVGVERNMGRVGAKHAPREIRKALYKYPVSKSHEDLLLFDAGDLNVNGELEEVHERLMEVVKHFLKDHKKVIVLGGGNDISYADCRALSESTKNRNILAFNVDRHLDVRAQERRNSGTPYRQLLEEKFVEPANFHEVGINSYSNSPIYTKYLLKLGVNIHYLGDLREFGIKDKINQILEESETRSIFWGFDMDVVRAVEAPGVSDPSPMGFTARGVCEIADCAAADPRTRIIEITEVNPEYDKDGITAKLAANIIMRALANS